MGSRTWSPLTPIVDCLVSIMSNRNYFQILSSKKEADKRIQKQRLTAKRAEKIVTFDEVVESRPPLRADMSGPTPTNYKVDYNSCSSPAYSFGRKCNDIVTSADGQRVSPFHIQPQYNADFPKPSPAAYEPSTAIGNGQYCYGSAPAFSIGPEKIKKRNNTPKQKMRVQGGTCGRHSHTNIGTLYRRIPPMRTTSTTELRGKPGPSACTYNVLECETTTMQRAPSFSMGHRINNSGFLGNAQKSARETPPCNKYNPLPAIAHLKCRSATISMCGERRGKRHDTGPFATLWKR